MSYTVKNYKTKKALKEAVDKHNKQMEFWSGPMRKSFHKYEVRCYNPGAGSDLSNYTGTVYLEGPHYPQPHKWYAQAEMVNGIIVKVK